MSGSTANGCGVVAYATHILQGVTDAVAISVERVHAYRSADGKAAVVTDLQTAGDRHPSNSGRKYLP